MSSRIKLILTVGFIIGGLLIMTYNFLPSKITVQGRKVNQNIKLQQLYKIKASEPINNNKSEILALFILKSNLCSACVNNMFDYINLLSHKNNVRISVVFMEANSQTVQHFVKVTKLSIPYRFAERSQLPVILQNAIQELMLIDMKSKKIFYRITIPSLRTTNLKYKKTVLKEALKYYRNKKSVLLTESE